MEAHRRGQQTFSVKGQKVIISGFAGQTVFCNIYMNVGGHVLMKLYLQKGHQARFSHWVM